jgi:glyoxylase-like metal-dependent hydrolase (beta-lactamase superfamily II)
MQLIFEQIRAGGDRNFGYLLGDRDAGRGVLIDPSYSPEQFVERAHAQHLSISHVVNTHGHPDHTNGNDAAVSMTGAAIASAVRSRIKYPVCPSTTASALPPTQVATTGRAMAMYSRIAFEKPSLCDVRQPIDIHESQSRTRSFIGSMGGPMWVGPFHPV